MPLYEPPKRKGIITGKSLAEMSDVVQRLIVPGPGIAMRRSGDQVAISATGGAASQGDGGSGGFYATISDVLGNILLCHKYNVSTGVTESNTIAVAKSYHTRRSTYDSVTIDGSDFEEYYTLNVTYTYAGPARRTASYESSGVVQFTQTQYISPMYYTGEVIGVRSISYSVAEGDYTAFYEEDCSVTPRSWVVG